MKYFILALLSVSTALAQISTQTVNDAYFGWHAGTNRLQSAPPNTNLFGSYFAWHLDNPDGPQVHIYNASDVLQAQYDEPSGFGSCNIARAWSVQSHASNVIVAIVDDHFDLDHPDTAGRWWINPMTGMPGVRIVNGVEFTNVNVDSTFVHGMQAAGIIGAIGNNSAGVVGICKDGVQIMPVACWAQFSGDPDLGRGIMWAATNGADIILFSYGKTSQTTNWTNAFMVAQARGCLVVVPVVDGPGLRNDIGAQVSTFPVPDYPTMWGRNLSTNIIPQLTNLLCVTGSTPDETRWVNTGWSTQFVDIVYPCRRIPTCLPPSQYTAHSGTSPAAAIAAGHAALLKQRYWNEEMWQIKERIMATVQVRAAYATNCLSSGQGDVYASMIWQRTNGPTVLRGFR